MLQCRVELEKTRLLVLEAADQLDRLGNKRARGTIAMAKVIYFCTECPAKLASRPINFLCFSFTSKLSELFGGWANR